jgi:hypothetical protein
MVLSVCTPPVLHPNVYTAACLRSDVKAKLSTVVMNTDALVGPLVVLDTVILLACSGKALLEHQVGVQSEQTYLTTHGPKQVY